VSSVVQEINLISPEHFAGKLPPHDVGLFLAALPPAVRAAVSMALQSRSCSKGRRPDWLSRAADIRFVGHAGNGATTLRFEAPTLGEAAEELYRQGELFPSRPDAQDTALDVFGDVLLDVAQRNADSERFDPPLLRRLVRFQRAFTGWITEARLPGRRGAASPPRLNLEVIRTARQFYEETPAPRKVRLAGILDMVRASNHTFAVRLDDGQEAKGSLVEGSVEALAAWLNKPVLLFGTAVFRPSGRLLRVDAEAFRPATAPDWFFAKMPKPLAPDRHRPATQDRRKMADGLKAVFGQWPGEESEEAIRAALQELS
jgi:hypothetical protein